MVFVGQLNPGSRSASDKDILHHFAMYVSQPEVATRVTVSQPCVIETKDVKDRCMQIVEMYLVLNGVVAIIVRCVVPDTGLEETVSAKACCYDQRGSECVVARDIECCSRRADSMTEHQVSRAVQARYGDDRHSQRSP